MRWTLSRTRELGARKRPSVRTPPLAHLPSPRGEPRRLRLRPGASHLYRSRASASLSHTHEKIQDFSAHASSFISMYSMIIRRYSNTRALTRRLRLSASRAATSYSRESLVRWFTTGPRFGCARGTRASAHRGVRADPGRETSHSRTEFHPPRRTRANLDEGPSSSSSTKRTLLERIQ